MTKNEKRAELFLKEVAPLLSLYEKKWRTYFNQIGLPFDEDILRDTVLKCYETIGRLGCKSGQSESMNYLFKAFKMNSIRELEYARNKYRDYPEDIQTLYETYLSKEHSVDYKITKDIWTEFQFNYILKEVELMWDKNTFYLFRLKYVLNLSDDEIRKKSKNENWKKDLKSVTKWLQNTIKKEDIIKEFEIKYPDLDLSVLEE